MAVRLGGALLVEFLGTFALCLTALLAGRNADPSSLTVALASGLILAAMVSAGAHTSYGLIQLLAAVVATSAAYAMFGGGKAAAAVVLTAVPQVSSEVSPSAAMLA